MCQIYHSNQTLWLSLLVKICLDKALLGWITKQEINGKRVNLFPPPEKNRWRLVFERISSIQLPRKNIRNFWLGVFIFVVSADFNLPETITASLQLKFLDAWNTFPFGGPLRGPIFKGRLLVGWLLSFRFRGTPPRIHHHRGDPLGAGIARRTGQEAGDVNLNGYNWWIHGYPMFEQRRMKWIRYVFKYSIYRYIYLYIYIYTLLYNMFTVSLTFHFIDINWFALDSPPVVYQHPSALLHG